MSTDQVIDLVTDENDEVIVIDDDSPKSSISEDSATMDAASAATIERAAEPAVMEQKPFAAQEPIPVDMDLDEVIPIPISNQTWVLCAVLRERRMDWFSLEGKVWRNIT